MHARIAAVPRLLAVVCAGLFASATITFAAEQATPPLASPPAPAAATAPQTLLVPDVRGKAYVFAKGMLEEAGFAWVVEGSVKGFAANEVASQSPAPGTRVVDNGAPTITLQLHANPAYNQIGSAENAAPFPGTKIRLPAKTKAKAGAKKGAAKKGAAKKAKTKAKAVNRPRAFAVPGAPGEPLGQPSLPAQARRLGAWLEKHRSATDANLRHFTFQHDQIVAGARFGWWGGAEALRTLVGVDGRAELLWGVGSRHRVVAEEALVEVQARSR